jgi:hypothetical protein
MLVFGGVHSVLAHFREGSVPWALAAMTMPPPMTTATSGGHNQKDEEELPRKKL